MKKFLYEPKGLLCRRKVGRVGRGWRQSVFEWREEVHHDCCTDVTFSIFHLPQKGKNLKKKKKKEKNK